MTQTQTQTLHEIVMQLDDAEGLSPDALWGLKHLAEMKGDELKAAQQRITALEGVLERMVHWFGRYPEWIPAPDQMENYRAAIADAREVLTQ